MSDFTNSERKGDSTASQLPGLFVGDVGISDTVGQTCLIILTRPGIGIQCGGSRPFAHNFGDSHSQPLPKGISHETPTSAGAYTSRDYFDGMNLSREAASPLRLLKMQTGESMTTGRARIVACVSNPSRIMRE